MKFEKYFDKDFINDFFEMKKQFLNKYEIYYLALGEAVKAARQDPDGQLDVLLDTVRVFVI